MHTFQRTMLTLGILLAITSVRVDAAAPVPPPTTPIFSTFKLEILPTDQSCLGTVDVPDIPLRPLCIKMNAARQGSAGDQWSRKEWLKQVSDACANAKGRFQDAGARVSCTLPAQPTKQVKSAVKFPPEDGPPVCPPDCLKPAQPSGGGKQAK